MITKSSGVITKTEMGNVVVAVCELMGIDLRPPVGSIYSCHHLQIVLILSCRPVLSKQESDMKCNGYGSIKTKASNFQSGSTLGLDYIPKRRDSVTVDING